MTRVELDELAADIGSIKILEDGHLYEPTITFTNDEQKLLVVEPAGQYYYFSIDG